MTPNDNNQNKGARKICFWMYPCERARIGCEFWGSLCLNPSSAHLLSVCYYARPSLSIFAIFFVSFSLLHHFILFHFIFILWFIFISIQINPHSPQLFALFHLFSSISSHCATFCYTLNCSIFFPHIISMPALLPLLLLFSSLAFHQALKVFYEI